MATLVDNPEFTANEVYEIQQTDRVEGAATGASYNGVGLSNQPHQQLANRTAFLKQRQDTNIANITALQNFVAGFVGSLQPSGYVKIPIVDVARGPQTLIVQWGWLDLGSVAIGADAEYLVNFPLAFPNAILAPPLATNVYVASAGMNVAASVVAWSRSNATFVLDVPAALHSEHAAGVETSGGLSWLAIGF